MPDENARKLQLIVMAHRRGDQKTVKRLSVELRAVGVGVGFDANGALVVTRLATPPGPSERKG